MDQSMRDVVDELCRYFRDFLETDFKRRKLPKRMLRMRDQGGHLVGINLRRYPRFSANIWEFLTEPYNLNYNCSVVRDQHHSNLNAAIRNLVDQRIDRIDRERVDQVRAELREYIIDQVDQYQENPQALHADIFQHVESQIFNEIIHPIASELEDTLDTQISEATSLYSLEDQLSERIVQAAAEPLAEAVNRLLATRLSESDLLDQVLQDFFSLPVIRERMREGFSTFAANDLYQEIHDLTSTTRQIENLEYYLCLGEVRYNNHTFSLFQIPFTIEENPRSFRLLFDPRVFVNKRAIEYISEEFGRSTGRPNRITVPDRIIYVDAETRIADIIDPLTQRWSNDFALPRTLDWGTPSLQAIPGPEVHITNNVWLSLFDKSEESLVNDYECLLEDTVPGGPMDRLTGAIGRFLTGNPDAIRSDVERDWSETVIADRLVFEAPIPLNEEQRKILYAAHNSRSRVLAIQGPPGTGKSHSITAIVFDAILNRQSVLILSDKGEALDVVEGKLNDCISKVRVEDSIKNPILRLGSADNTYRQITKNATVQQLRQHYDAFKRNAEKLAHELSEKEKSLKSKINQTVDAYNAIRISDIHRLLSLESKLLSIDPGLIEAAHHENIPLLQTIKEIVQGLSEQQRLINLADQFGSPVATGDLLALLQTQDLVSRLDSQLAPEKRQALNELTEIDGEDLSILQNYLPQYAELQWPIFGFVFCRSKARALDRELSSRVKLANPVDIHRRVGNLVVVNEVMSEMKMLLDRNMHHHDTLAIGFDLLTSGHTLPLTEAERSLQMLLETLPSGDDVDEVLHLLEIERSDLSTWIDRESMDRVSATIEFAELQKEYTEKFGRAPDFDFVGEKSNLERLHTHRLVSEMDGRVVDFVDKNRTLAGSLKNIIRKKEKFPKEEFSRLVEAFPCIIASIREFAEYIPLEAEFDLVIIDEGSQVSIAQALPALLRSKTLLVFGDMNQFSNVKTVNASHAINKEYLGRLRQKAMEAGVDVRGGRFDRLNIQTSVLEFADMIANYTDMLRKHFRGYRELISFSNRYFYQGQLQAIKIRGRPIGETIQFTILENDERESVPHSNANGAEADFILAELDRLLDLPDPPTVGVITPFTNQQKYIMRRVRESDKESEYLDRLKLKVMTFDTCQGEERQLIFFSMVATPEHDRTGYVFPRDLDRADDVEDVLRLQRLNVGFSRCQETMHFVLSKPIDEFSGSIGVALRHYQAVLAAGDEIPTQDSTESPMERKVLQWIQNTQFWSRYGQGLTLRTQFPMGDYLKQLDSQYIHPKYRVDFLIKGHVPAYGDGINRTETSELAIVIEYDGFREHFEHLSEVGSHNWESYLSQDDLEREKVIESYGFKVVRINRFNLGDDPVQTLSDRLFQLVNPAVSATGIDHAIRNEVELVVSGNVRECPKCQELKPSDAFRDASLKRGIGRVCKACKESKSGTRMQRQHQHVAVSSSPCPNCGAVMRLRTARRGHRRGKQFWGCSEYPRCTGTRPLNS